MKTCCIVLLLAFSVSGHAAEIASISFRKVEPLLKERVLAHPRYQPLQAEVEAMGTFDPSSFVKTDDEGNFVIDKGQMADAGKMATRFQVEKRLDEAMRRELVTLLSELDMTHKIVLDSDEDKALLYSQTEIEDITQKIYQALVDLASKTTGE